MMPANMNMSPNPMMGMAPNMNGMNPMAHMNGHNGFPPQMNNGWSGYQQGFPNQMGFSNQQGWNNGFQPNNMGYGNMSNGMHGGMNGYGGGGNWNPNQNQGFHGNNMGWQGQQNGNFPNQQRTVFTAEQPNQQDAYERKPLNPHRSQNKHRKHRPQDFHYV